MITAILAGSAALLTAQPNNLFTWQNSAAIDCCTISFSNGAQTYLTIAKDGRVTIAKDFDPDLATQLFWNQIEAERGLPPVFPDVRGSLFHGPVKLPAPYAQALADQCAATIAFLARGNWKASAVVIQTADGKIVCHGDGSAPEFTPNP